MSFFNEIFEDLGNETKKNLLGYTITIFSGKGIIVEGYKKIVAYKEDKIVLKLKIGNIFICGNCLNIAKLTKNEVLILGEIISVFLGDYEGNSNAKLSKNKNILNKNSNESSNIINKSNSVNKNSNDSNLFNKSNSVNKNNNENGDNIGTNSNKNGDLEKNEQSKN
ncbi:MAG: YabP/YqfC family sporulation protein [Clostridia bacterium]